MSLRKPILTGLVTVGLLAGGLLLSSSSALALETNFKVEIGEGKLTDGGGVLFAVSESTGDVYADSNVWGPLGNLLATGQEPPIVSTPGGPFTYATGFRASPEAEDTNGDRYVAESEAKVVNVFNPKGELISVLQGAPTGPGGALVQFGRPLGVAIDRSTSPSDPSAGDIYVLDLIGLGSNGLVDVFNSKNEFVRQITGPPGKLFGYLTNLLVDESGLLYVSDISDGMIDVFTPAVLTLPDALTVGTSAVTSTTATVAGSVTPDGLDATCAVEYTRVGVPYNGTSVPCEPADVGSGEVAVPITAKLTGLLPRSTKYTYRICPVNVNAIPHCDSSQPLTTLPDLPTVPSESAAFATPSEVVLGGVVNPETGPTTFHFAYGPTSAYGQRFPSSSDLSVGTGEAPLALEGQSIPGLQPDSTYHYTVVATNAAGTTYGPDQTFTTPAGPVPDAATGGLSSLSQEAATVTGVVDPAGVPTTYEFDLGTDTSYGTRVFGSAGTGSSPEGFSAAFRSLSPNTTYHYRLLASNQYGTTYGVDQTFTTPGFPSGLPAAPTSLGLVAIPNVAFPSEAGTTTTATTKKALTNAQKLAAALKACRGQEFGFERRKACEKQERKRYAPKKKKASKAKRASGRASGKGGK